MLAIGRSLVKIYVSVHVLQSSKCVTIYNCFCKSPDKSHGTICISNLTEAKEHSCGHGHLQCINKECILEHYLCDDMETCTDHLRRFCLKVKVSATLHLILENGLHLY